MSHYIVIFLITFTDDEDEILYSVTEGFDAKNLQSLFDLLNEGIQNDEIAPEENIMNQPEGDVNIDYVIIYDNDGKEIYRDKELNEKLSNKEFNENLVPIENNFD